MPDRGDGHAGRLDTRADDAALFAEAREGGDGAFTRLYHRYHAAIHRFAWHMSGSTAIADDVTQDVFVSILQGADRFDPAKGSLIAWLMGSARHRVWRHLGRRGREVDLDDDHAEAVADRDDASPLHQLTHAELIATVRGAILQLPAHQREVVVLCDIEELEYADAALVLGCPIGTVRSRLSRARGRLAVLLREAGGANTPVGRLERARCAI